MSYPDSENSTALLIVVIVLSFIIASSLNVYPLSPSMATLRPMIMIMVLIYWLLFQPRYVGIFTAFTIGLITDLLMDTHLGQQAFAAVVVALVIKITSIYVRQLNTISAWLIASLGLIVFQLNLWMLQMFIQNTFIAKSALSLMMSIISWPLVLLALRKFAR
ncbi:MULTISPECIES: rod shape-determining protein MreD [Psychrobacter]|jgi:rod shape-determining protein MreD|uniref:Rod shape-determining protein MreD n=2 Tax=Psychrobacter TaxID=497 RepID=A0A1G6X5N0_9GAMM|nr:MULTISPECIES: rod shape-determining protein MreD [Psychrobacter]HBD04573.1 rod shape-determining protein MreD [Psychrobacter sp.]AOY44823.1 rod shape-determining protein [Psychrobacter sp. AntiMn-1]MBZ1393002.1 rod shape-determining protein MreD [Psychrobacter pacificensis]MDE0842935.1 rod shape-determining protein MreD [Psychrobacter pacificensis]MDH4904160.1 rod shape-determining protein MreD [Psychrobacter pocilloporae]|tara:strand:+ start:619 stop:1104 length:486 start_codon:yes stop_codon:yes gene_type:complete